ncbi:hypothetical protein CAAN1_03S01354 [[Candida] anglica]|uniref:Uncharacterized protein n=1 Tax=[Candida] anglica TaxID=148631 RepID=A0ABP0EH22_9ASCO
MHSPSSMWIYAPCGRDRWRVHRCKTTSVWKSCRVKLPCKFNRGPLPVSSNLSIAFKKL